MKKTLKAVLAAALALVMLLSVIPMTVGAAYTTPFTDVKTTDYFYESVIWALSEGITTGTTATKFAPESTCTRGQVVTFLWRAMGKPEPTSTENPFEDVKGSDYYYKPILWAIEKGITTGTSAKRFSPAVTCTNAHILTFIWRALGEPEKIGAGEWYTDAENWAKKNGLLDGTYTGDFNVTAGCPRANVVEYLYRYMESSTLFVYVAAEADAASADGSVDKPFATIEAARDYLRTVDKSGYKAVKVMIGAGEYVISEAINLTAADSGTKDCPISYIGAPGATIIGGIKLTAKDFTKASGDFAKLFPEEARDKIVMVDMNKFGYTSEMIRKDLESFAYLEDIPFLSVNGVRQTIAQFPNNTWIHVGETVTHSADGTTDTAIDRVTLQTVEYGEEYYDTVMSWSETLPILVRARLFKLWCPGDTKVAKRHEGEAKMDIYFAGDHEPDKGTILYWYNVPEELDIPGEYIYDSNAVLYYYPTEEFETATLTVPLSDGMFKLNKANYITFDGLNLTSSNGDIFNGEKVNFITIKNCDLSACKDKGIEIHGNDLTIENNIIHDIGSHAITLTAGDHKTLTGGNALVYNNDIYEFGVTDPYGYAVDADGVNITVSHNDIHDGNFKGVHFAGAVNALAEYNDVWRVSLLSEDTGVMSADSKDNSNIIFRYNYVHDCFPEGEAAKILDHNPDYGYYGTFAFYYDNGCSYIETYGNVVYGVDTGYLSNGGRHNSCHNNLFIDCRMWYVWFSEWTYSNALGSDGKLDSRSLFEDFVYTDAWKALNPDLASLKCDTTGVDPLDPMLWCAPAYDECYDNWIHYNKAERVFTNWGIRPYNIETYVKQFNPDMKTDESQMTLYSSKREAVDLEDIITNKAAGVVDMTWEQFQTIGRID